MTFQDILLRRGIRFKSGQGDKNKTLLCCPFCATRGKGTDSGFRLCVHAMQGWGRCLRCDWKHRFAAFPVLRQLGLVEDSISLPDNVLKDEFPPVTLPRDFQLLVNVVDDLDMLALRYVKNRGVTRTQIKECKIGVSYINEYAYRIIFPIYAGKKLSGINARDFTGHREPKYLNNRGEKFLFNFNPAAKTCILSEGVFKALRIAQTTEHNSASLLGHNLTDNMLQQIKDSDCKEVILYPDPDLAGRKGFAEIADKLCEAWNGLVKIVHPIKIPADEDSFVKIGFNLENCILFDDPSSQTRGEARVKLLKPIFW